MATGTEGDINFRESAKDKRLPVAREQPVKARFVGDELVAADSSLVGVDRWAERRTDYSRIDTRPVEQWGPRHRRRYHHYATPPSVLSDFLMALLGIGAVLGWGLLLINLLSGSTR